MGIGKRIKEQRDNLGLTQEQLADIIGVTKGAKTKGKKILQPDAINKLFEIDYIMDHGKEKKCFLIYAWIFFVLTGLRRGELCGLQNLANNIK